MSEVSSFVGFEILGVALAFLTIAPVIRYVALEGQMMRFLQEPSRHFAPLLDMMRERARYLLKAMIGFFLSFLVLLVCRVITEVAPMGSASVALSLHTVMAALAGYSAIQMLLEIRLTLIGFTYQGVSSDENR